MRCRSRKYPLIYLTRDPGCAPALVPLAHPWARCIGPRVGAVRWANWFAIGKTAWRCSEWRTRCPPNAQHLVCEARRTTPRVTAPAITNRATPEALVLSRHESWDVLIGGTSIQTHRAPSASYRDVHGPPKLGATSAFQARQRATGWAGPAPRGQIRWIPDARPHRSGRLFADAHGARLDTQIQADRGSPQIASGCTGGFGRRSRPPARWA
jgi:hypothetical protein